MTKTKFCLLGLCCAVMATTLLTASAQTTVRLHGATSPAKILQPKKEAIEAKTGTKLEIVGNGSGRGLTDLIAGSADVAMVGASLKATAAVMNKEKPGSVDVAGLTEIPLSKIKLLVISHPGNGVKSLTLNQLADVFSGKVSNWKEVGGSDLPIKIVLPFVGDGARTSVQDQVLNGGDYAKSAVLRNLSKELSPVVAQLPGACSFVSAKNVDGNVSVISIDKELFMPMVFVVKGEVSGEIKKVVDEARPLLAE